MDLNMRRRWRHLRWTTTTNQRHNPLNIDINSEKNLLSRSQKSHVLYDEVVKDLSPILYITYWMNPLRENDCRRNYFVTWLKRCMAKNRSFEGVFHIAEPDELSPTMHILCSPRTIANMKEVTAKAQVTQVSVVLQPSEMSAKVQGRPRQVHSCNTSLLRMDSVTA